jgi:thiosulfate/3-mercaptopyruvate sulfurtransferase
MKRPDPFSAITALWLAGLLFATGSLFTPPVRAQGQTRASASKVRAEMLVSTDWLASQLNNPQVVVLHIARDRAHYDAGHIPGARFVAWSEITTTRDGVLNELPPVEQLQQLFERLGAGDDARLVLYGDNAPLAAARAYFTLDYLGHGEHAALLDGGLEKWKAEQRPLATEAPQVKAARFTPRPRPQAVVDLQTMLKLSQAAAGSASSGVTLLDARPADDYTGARAGNAARSGHIPGAENLYWLQSVTSREQTTLRPIEEVRKLYEALGIQPGGKVVTYCGSGVQASYAYFVAKYLGYEAVMYDGSFSEWMRAEGTKVVTGAKPK